MAADPLPVTLIDDRVAHVLGPRLRAQIDVRRYPLEWHLPWWLGQAHDVAATSSLELVVANVLGLGAIRLRDDIADGELGREDRQAAAQQATRMMDAALDIYRTAFPTSSPIWSRIDASLSAWTASAGPASRELASRGAPLRISAHATLELANKPYLAGLVDDCLDHALTALVMFDHLVDWDVDLAGGRWNAFVARLVDQDGLPPATVRAAVDRELLIGDPIAPYAHEILAQLRSASQRASDLGSAELVAHFDELRVRLDEHSRDLRTVYRSLARKAAALFEPTQVTEDEHARRRHGNATD